MKILMIVNWYTPKDENVLKAGVFHNEQALALRDCCTDVRLYWPFDETIKGCSEEEEWGIYTYRSSYDNEKNIRSFFYAVHYLEYIIREYKPDIIHAHCAYPAGLIACMIARKYKLPIIITEHCPIEQMDLNNVLKKWIRKIVYSKSNYNICVSRDSRNRLKEIYPSCDFRVIYNAIMNPNSFEYDNRNYKTVGAINCAIVAAFYSKTIKGYQYLIPAIKKVRDKGVNIVLHICGGGKYEKLYKDMAKDLEINEYCIFYGQQERKNVYAIVSQMDFCISASEFECSGVSVQEEMLLGKPVLVTKSGGANSLTTKDTSIVVERKSEEALVEGILDMSQQYKCFDANKIKQYAYDNFEISNVTKRYMKLYRSMNRE